MIRPLPILKVEGQVNPLDPTKHAYLLRFTPEHKFSEEQLVEWLKGFSQYIYSLENSAKEKLHYHVCLFDPRPQEVIERLKEDFMLKYWPKDQRKRGFGHQSNFQKVTTIEQAVTYVTKDGTYHCSEGVNKENLDKYYKASFKKFSKAEFQKQFDTLAKRYKTTDMAIGEFMEEFIVLKAEYGQPIKMSYIHEVALSHAVRKDKREAKQLVTDYLYKIAVRY